MALREKIRRPSSQFRMALSPEYASDMVGGYHTLPTANVDSMMGVGMNRLLSGLSIPIENTSSPLRRSGRSRSNEQDSPSSESKAKKMRSAHMRLPRGVQRQSRNGAAYSGWVTVEGYRLLGPARPTAELASQDRERLAEAKLVGGLPEARKVIQQLHAEVASTRRIKSQYLTQLSMPTGVSSIQLRSSSVSHLSPLTRTLPRSVCVMTPCGSKDMWFLRSDKIYSSFTPRTDVPLDKGVHLLEFGAIRGTVEEARRDSCPMDELSTPVAKEEMAELGNGKTVHQQESVWGFCAVAELVLENRTAFVGVCIFCDVILTAGPARGSRSSAEADAFLMVSDVLSSGLSYAANRQVLPLPNPAEDLFLPTSTSQHDEEEEEEYRVKEEFRGEESIEEDEEYVDDEEDKETHVPITPSGPIANLAEESSSEEAAGWTTEGATSVSTPDN